MFLNIILLLFLASCDKKVAIVITQMQSKEMVTILPNLKNPLIKDSTTIDTQEFIVNDIAVPNQEILSKYIDAKYYTKLPNGTIKLTLLQVKKIFSTSYYTNYAAWLAYNVDVTVRYSLPATYASFGSPDLFRISDDTKMNVPFFEKYLGISLGELNYGIYDKITIDKLLKP